MLALTDAAVNVRMEVVLDALVRCITVNASVDDHYDTLLAESLVNGFDFVVYAGPQWDNSTNGYYRTSTAFFPDGSGRSAPSTRTLPRRRLKATPAA